MKSAEECFLLLRCKMGVKVSAAAPEVYGETEFRFFKAESKSGFHRLFWQRLNVFFELKKWCLHSPPAKKGCAHPVSWPSKNKV